MRADRVFAIAALLLAGTALQAAPGDAERFAAEWKQWHAERIGQLRAPQGWLALVGLHWLEPGPNQIDGLPGVFLLENGRVGLARPSAAGSTSDGWLLPGKKSDASAIQGQPEATAWLESDKNGKPDRIVNGTRTAQVIDRGGKLALRVWDSASPARAAFTDVATFPLDPRLKVEARWEAYPAPREVLVPSVVGIPEKGLAPGRAHFSLQGRELSLEPVLEGDGLFFVFKDKTAPRETYGGGRFLDAELPKGGVVVLDFNRAVNPPCAFTRFATCPLPLPENALPVRIEAGEKFSGHGH